jgi:hypothetical protein
LSPSIVISEISYLRNSKYIKVYVIDINFEVVSITVFGVITLRI